MKFIPKIAEIIENHGKRKTLQQLLLMTERQLIDCGYSPELLSEGVKAWPWREISENLTPLQFDQDVNLGAVSTNIGHTDSSLEKRFPVQKHAA